MSQQVCPYYGRGTCRKGDKCKFKHEGKSAGGKLPPSPQRKAQAAMSSPPRNQGPPPRAPGNICNYFWSNGACNMGSSCRFQHTINPALQPSSPTPSRPTTITPETIAAFLTQNGLEKLSISSSDSMFSSGSATLNAIETNNHLRRFLYSDFRFKSASQMTAFINLLSNASSENSSWTQDDGQVLLHTLASGEGILRIGDILRFTDVSPHAGFKQLSFQQGYIRLLGYYSSTWVVKSTLNHHVNALYSLIHNEFGVIASTIETSMTSMISARTFKEAQAGPNSKELSGVQAFKIISTVLFEYLTRFKQAVASHPQLPTFIRSFVAWFETWAEGVSQTPPTFQDPFTQSDTAQRAFILRQIRADVERLLPIIDRSLPIRERQSQESSNKKKFSSDAILAQIQREYAPPGHLREEGPRHDNDKLLIAEIRIAPTHEELLTDVVPFLPANIPLAPHPFESGSMERLLDIQFRLLREELIAPIRSSVQLIVADLNKPAKEKSKLTTILKDRGGRYKGILDTKDSIVFSVFTNIAFQPIKLDRRGLSFGVEFDSPPGKARSPTAAARVAYWEAASKKRLMQGGLVALVWRTTPAEAPIVYLGVVSSSSFEIQDSAKKAQNRVRIRVSFFDPLADLRIVQSFKEPESGSSLKLLLEAPVFYEGIRPFLEALRTDPALVPFSRYLTHQEDGKLSDVKIEPPWYTTVPGKQLELRSLLLETAEVESLPLSATDPNSILNAREELKKSSSLDPSQADAIVDALSREVSLIQGPPGTGKSYTGVELIRVLLANKISPILLIAFTNHALDHMLSSILDAKITSNIVRLGGRSSDERIAEFALEKLEKIKEQSGLDRSIGREYRELKLVEEEMDKLMRKIVNIHVPTPQIQSHASILYPVLIDSLSDPPYWIRMLYESKAQQSEEWTTVGAEQGGADDGSLFAYWMNGRDLAFLGVAKTTKPAKAKKLSKKEKAAKKAAENAEKDQKNRFASMEVEETHEQADSEPPVQEEVVLSSLASEFNNGFPINLPSFTVPPASGGAEPAAPEPPVPEEVNEPLDEPEPPQVDLTADPEAFFKMFNFASVPAAPTGNRPIEILLEEEDVWKMSHAERQRLTDFWITEVREAAAETQVQEFTSLRDRHSAAQTRYNAVKDQTRIEVLKKTDIVGCTTTGAAKLAALLKGFGPKVMIVEEAGQVLEAHILGSLVPSVQHLIMIGDPLQLRPNLANYSLSMEHPRGGKYYKFDQSLMERLSTSGLPMSRIDVQRRMRPSIASLIRNTLYPTLEDHDLVKQYPPVRGIARNVFFLSHSHKENGSDEDSMSKHNDYEVQMIRDLVVYFLRQGIYSEQGDIVILAAYLGQIPRIRDSLAGVVTTVIDERDATSLAERGDESVIPEASTTVERVKVSKRVLIRTVDNFQGEEAKIIILSLIRNSGTPFDPLQDLTSFTRGARSSIGFLRSENRTNVALSRAKHGLFILGNAVDLASGSRMWGRVLSELQECDAVGAGFPISCHRHPGTVHNVDRPGILPIIAPDGGCLEPCNVKLSCGHTCPYKCHSDDENHVLPMCAEPCTRLCPRSHPCNRRCSDNCGDCQFPVANVPLSCGHVKPTVPCFQARDPTLVKCKVKVIKKLLWCEHSAEMSCCDDPAVFDCQTLCEEPMACCSRVCMSRCYECQSMSSDSSRQKGKKPVTEPEVPKPILRVVHPSHPCGKDLYCRHPCTEPCAEGHVCSGSCTRPCLQSCVHQACKKPCSAVCAPCMNPCAWQCPHHSCPLPCGSICARLPCDEPCQYQLECGHDCPSVCGEPCELQTCTMCATSEELDQVVDLIMGSTLRDLQKGSGGPELDERTITLSCRHVFTVETLDGVAEMSECYEQDTQGRWNKLKMPPSGLKKPPVCPNCRSTITVRRYGRSSKRAALDLLEHNVASSLSRGIQAAHRKIKSFDQAAAAAQIEESAKRSAKLSVLPPNAEKWAKSQQELQRALNNSPTPLLAINLSKDSIHCIPSSHTKIWAAAVKPLLDAYADALRVTSTRPAHVKAYEASFSTLYRDELAISTADPARAPRYPEQHAMRMAGIRIGQPQPRADKRYTVEAFWATIELRFMLAELAQKWMSALSPEKDSTQRFLWSHYILFIYASASRDAEIAKEIASESAAHRQFVRSTVLALRAEFELFRFNVQLSGHTELPQDERKKVVAMAQEKLNAARETARNTMHQYMFSRRQSQIDEEAWLQTELSSPTETLIEEWGSLIRSLTRATFYEPVSLSEKMDIVRAFRQEFSHRGHFYCCPNGHVYVIGECGGANQASTCPECGASVGGTGHTLTAANTSATDYEEILRQQGSQASPWAWGAGV